MSSYIPLKDLMFRIDRGFCDSYELRRYMNSKVTTPLKGINDEEVVIFLLAGVINRTNIVSLLKSDVKNVDSVNKEVLLLNGVDSATIEGARTTVNEVKKAINSNPKSKSEIMALNVLSGMSYAFKDVNVFTVDGMLSLWKIISNGCCENKSVQGDTYRNGMVYIGNSVEVIHTPEVPEKIPERMYDLAEFSCSYDLHPIIKSAVIHFYYTYIHPMCDGNGRTARALMQAYLQHNGYEWINRVPIISGIRKDISGYYGSLKASQEPVNGMIDVTPFVMYMLDVIYSSVRDFTSYSVELSDIERKLISKMSRRGKGSEISVRGCSKVLKVSENDALFILMSMVDKGVLVRNGNVYKLC